ncbi:hypothetical protein Tco_0776142, partial [Tanacetum coccineum]
IRIYNGAEDVIKLQDILSFAAMANVVQDIFQMSNYMCHWMGPTAIADNENVIIISHYMTIFPDISRRAQDIYHNLQDDDIMKNIFNLGRNKNKVGMRIPAWMITKEMKQTEHYRISTRLTPLAPVPTADKSNEMLLQDTLQVSLAEHKSREEQEARENVALVNEHWQLRRLRSLLKSLRIPLVEIDQEKEEENTKDTEVEPNIVIPVNVDDEEDEITDEVLPRNLSTLGSLDTEKLQELTVTHPTPSSDDMVYLFAHLQKRFMPRTSSDYIADNLHDVMMETLPSLVKEKVTKQVKKEVPVQILLDEGLVINFEKFHQTNLSLDSVPRVMMTDSISRFKSSSSFTFTSPEVSELEAYLEKDSIPRDIDSYLPSTLEISSSNPTSPTLTGEKVCSWKTPMFFSLIRFVWKMMTRIAIRKKIICLLAKFLNKKPKLLSRPQEVEEIKDKQEEEISSNVPINTIVMPIRITFDNPIDFNDHFSKPKDLKKDLTISFDSTTKSSILPPPLLDSDSPFTAELSASVTLNSLGNENKVFKPGILVYHTIHDKNLVTLEENLKANISFGTLLVFKEPSFLLPPPEPPDKCLNFEPILVMKNVVLNDDLYQRKKTIPLNVEDVNSFAFLIWLFLPFGFSHLAFFSRF